MVINYQIQHWISQQAKALWRQERRDEAAQYPWPPPSSQIEY